jgi:hypothetical protein
MSFGSPEWFFLLPALIALGWRRREWRFHEPVRVAALITLVLALADPRLRIGGSGLDLWVLMDRSDSVAEQAASQAPEVAAILERTKRGDDRVFFVDYAVDAVRRDQGDPVLRGGTHRTRTDVALEFALAQFAPDRAARLLVLGDGYSTAPLGMTAEKVLRSGVPLDYRLTGGGNGTDYRVGRVATPSRVLPGEAFLVEFSIAGNFDGPVPWEVEREGGIATQGVAQVRGGVAHVRLTDRVGGSGAVRYVVRVKPARDAHPENNHADSWVEVAGGPRVVLVTNYPDDPLAALLRAQGLIVDLVTDPGRLASPVLTGARLVVINNVPASRMAPDFLGALEFFVREQGGGLLMAGGQNSFGSGGYFSSAIDPLLPVSMELRKEHRKLATAMSIVLDRSGSMAASAGAGVTKMDLANSGTARAIELLGEFDAVSIHAVDSAPHEVVGLAKVAGNRERMIDAARRIRSSGGGIYVYEGLKAGWEQLKKAQTGQRHLILFADAADAEEPGDYKNLLAEMRTEGATVSVIGLGSSTDSDAAFLRDVAERGGGRIFFNANASELPEVFAQETVSVARSAFIKERTPTSGTAGWSEIAARTPRWLDAIDAYNLGYLRPEATASLVTTDEYQAPLVAAWARGAGRVAAVTFPLGGPYSDRARAWPGYGDFVQTLTRWLAGEDTPTGMALRTHLDGERLTLDLLYDDTWTARVAQTAPVAMLAVSGTDRSKDDVRPLVWERIEPGLFRASALLDPGHRVRGVVRVGSATLPFGPLAPGGSAEWSFEAARVQELRQLSARSGGVERLNLASIWDAPRAVNYRGIRGWLLVLWLVLLLADAALTQLDVSLLPRRRSRL